MSLHSHMCERRGFAAPHYRGIAKSSSTIQGGIAPDLSIHEGLVVSGPLSPLCRALHWAPVGGCFQVWFLVGWTACLSGDLTCTFDGGDLDARWGVDEFPFFPFPPLSLANLSRHSVTFPFASAFPVSLKTFQLSDNRCRSFLTFQSFRPPIRAPGTAITIGLVLPTKAVILEGTTPTPPYGVLLYYCPVPTGSY